MEIENVKRVQAVMIEPSPSGLTVIGGRNGQGKTSVLDAIVWALGGNKYKPSSPQREDSSAPPRVCIEMDNGLVVSREGKNASLKVLDSYGNKAGQALLDELIGQLALDLPKFLRSSDKANVLLQVVGVGKQLAEIDKLIEQAYNERHVIGQTALRKRKHAEDLPFDPTAPAEEVSASELIQQQQAILTKNGANQKFRAAREETAIKIRVTENEVKVTRERLAELERRLAELQDRYATASKTAETLTDESTAELEESLRDIDNANRRVRANSARRVAEQEASDLEAMVGELTERLNGHRETRLALLRGAALPLPGLSIDETGELIYNGRRWDCMSASEQLRVGVAIVRKLRPDCQFVLLDKLEQMDLGTMREFGEWLEGEGLQAIATRVSTGGECSLIIEDGLVVGGGAPVAVAPQMFDTEGF